MWFEYLGTLVVGILFLAIFCEGSITFFYTDVVKLFGELTPRQFLRQYSARYVALILGLLLAFGFRAKIPDLPNLEVVRAWIGIPVSGVVIGRGASYTMTHYEETADLGTRRRLLPI
jgi:hypothetical protein